MNRTLLLIPVAVAALALSACSGGDEAAPASPAGSASGAGTTAPASTAPASAAATQAAVAPTAGATAAGASTSAPTSPVGKVSANNATRAELQAAFQAAGISGAAQWAREVEEYRPYPASDPTLAKLRQNLVKYNPGPGVVDALIGQLSLP